MRNVHRLAVVSAVVALVAAPLVAQTFTKTVGLVPPPACAPSNTVTAAQGQTVYYCYAFSNPNNSTYGYDLYDNRLGWVAQNATALPNAVSYQFASAAADFTNGSPMVNNATWIVYGFTTGSAIASVVQAYAASVPALGSFGLVALGLGLVGGGLLLLRRLG